LRMWSSGACPNLADVDGGGTRDVEAALRLRLWRLAS
jgi:hypothetical protein